MTRSRWMRAVTPLTLIALTLYVQMGCIYIPMFGRKLQGTNVSKQVGYFDSDRPPKVAHARRDDVIRLLGEPFAQKPDGSAMAYRWRVQNGIAIWPLCGFYAESIDGHRDLILRFDRAGILESFELLKRNDSLMKIGDSGGPPGLPGDFYPKEERVPSRRPANAPQGSRYQTQHESNP
jgi:hypothetical protein